LANESAQPLLVTRSDRCAVMAGQRKELPVQVVIPDRRRIGQVSADEIGGILPMGVQDEQG
jgi:hypothetical protein